MTLWVNCTDRNFGVCRGERAVRIREYGKGHKDAILLLHGGGLSWWNYREAAESLGAEYHVILPILDGHAGSDRPFTTIEENAAEIISFMDEYLNGSVLLMGGLSLGGQVLLEILSQRRDICKYALVESASVIPSKLTNALIAPAFGSSYGLIKNRSFANLQFRSLHMKPDLFEDYYRDTCRITKENMIAFLKANTSYEPKRTLQNTQSKIRIVVGGKERKIMLQSGRLLNELLPGSVLVIKEGLYHGEYSLNHPEEYAGEVREMIGGGNKAF